MNRQSREILFFIGLLLSGLLFSNLQTQAQCPNLNFSMGNFTNWQGYVGSCDSGNISIAPSAIIPGRHTIMNRSLIGYPYTLYDEQCSKIKKIPDGFAYAARIGNSNTGAEMEALEYTMTVDSMNALLAIHLAWVMEDPSHSWEEQPNFKIIIKDSNGVTLPDILPCGNAFDYQGLACSGTVLGRDWSTTNYNLSSLIGQTIKIYFETRDCTCGNHFGYAYFVAECKPWSINLRYCKGQTAAHLKALDGYANYKWTRSSQPNWSHTGTAKQSQNITISDPVEGEIVTCIMSSGDGWDWPYCAETLHRVIEKTIIDADFAYGIIENEKINATKYDTCNRTATFIDFTTATNSKQTSRSWYIHGYPNIAIPRDSIITVTFPDPRLASPPKDFVRYLVRLTVEAENGCADTSSQHITIYPPYYLDSARVNSIHAHFTSQQETHCNYTNLVFTNNSFADVELFGTRDCRIDPDTNIYLNCIWNWGDGSSDYQRIANGSKPTIEYKYHLPNTETKVVVKLTITMDNFDNKAIYTDTLTILPRPTAAFIDDGHEFSSCSKPEDGSDSRKVRFANQSQGNIEQLTWNFGDGYEISGNIDDSLVANPTHAYPNAAGKYDILLVAIDSNQCVDSLIKYNHVNILGVRGDFSYWDTTACVPLTVTFTPLFNSDYDFSPDSVVFDAGDGRKITTLPPFFHNKSLHYTKGGNYLPSCFLYKTITLNGENELCVLEVKGKDSIRVVELIADFETMEYYLLDSSVVFTNTSIVMPANMPYDLLIWNFNNGDTSYDFDGKTTFNKTGEYIVKLQMKIAQCLSEKRKIIKVIKKSDLPIYDRGNNNSSIFVYPNPASTQLFIEHSFQENVNYSIYNILGQNILQGILQEEISSINIESLAKGIYYLKIIGKENTIVKFVKE